MSLSHYGPASRDTQQPNDLTTHQLNPHKNCYSRRRRYQAVAAEPEKYAQAIHAVHLRSDNEPWELDESKKIIGL